MASDNEASCESDPNFAVICAFMEKFGTTCGLQSIDFLELQEMLENTQEVPQELVDLHIKLLRKSRKTVSNERWEKAVIKFCHTFCVQDAWEIERFGYKKARLSSKLRVLKELLEMQFDYNTRFKAEINKMSAEELRSQPIGRDKQGHAYWFQNDNSCQIRVYKDDQDEETWTLVAKDRDGLTALINELSGESDSKISSESAINEEDSNSLAEKPIIDTGQVDSSSDSNKKSSGDSENSNESTKKEENISSQTEAEAQSDEEEEEEMERETNHSSDANANSKRRRESEDSEPNQTKKKKIEIEVSEAIEEPVMLIKGVGSGEDNQGVNPIVGDEIEEDLMFVYGEGNGVDCETGNEDKPGETQTNQSEGGGERDTSDSGLVSISDSKNCVNDEVPTSHVKSPYKLGTIIDTKTDNKFFNTVKNPTKKSRWDVETIIAKDVPESGRVKELVTKWEQINDEEKDEPPKKSMFFFGPGCLQFTPATVGFGQKVPPEKSDSLDVDKKGDVGYRIEGDNKVVTSVCVQSGQEAGLLVSQVDPETPIEPRIDKLENEVTPTSDTIGAALNVEQTKVEEATGSNSCGPILRDKTPERSDVHVAIEKEISENDERIDDNCKVPEVTAALVECEEFRSGENEHKVECEEPQSAKKIAENEHNPEENSEPVPVVEEPCVKTHAYLLGKENNAADVVENHQPESSAQPETAKVEEKEETVMQNEDLVIKDAVDLTNQVVEVMEKVPNFDENENKHVLTEEESGSVESDKMSEVDETKIDENEKKVDKTKSDENEKNSDEVKTDDITFKSKEDEAKETRKVAELTQPVVDNEEKEEGTKEAIKENETEVTELPKETKELVEESKEMETKLNVNEVPSEESPKGKGTEELADFEEAEEVVDKTKVIKEPEIAKSGSPQNNEVIEVPSEESPKETEELTDLEESEEVVDITEVIKEPEIAKSVCQNNEVKIVEKESVVPIEKAEEIESEKEREIINEAAKEMTNQESKEIALEEVKEVKNEEGKEIANQEAKEKESKNQELSTKPAEIEDECKDSLNLEKPLDLSHEENESKNTSKEVNETVDVKEQIKSEEEVKIDVVEKAEETKIDSLKTEEKVDTIDEDDKSSVAKKVVADLEKETIKEENKKAPDKTDPKNEEAVDLKCEDTVKVDENVNKDAMKPQNAAPKRGRKNIFSESSVFTRRTTRSTKNEDTIEEVPTSVPPPNRRGRPRANQKAGKSETHEGDSSKKMKLSNEEKNENDEASEGDSSKKLKMSNDETQDVKKTLRSAAKEETPVLETEKDDDIKIVEDEKIEDELDKDEERSSSIGSPNAFEPVVLDSSSSNDVMEVSAKDPLAAEEESKDQNKPMSLATFSLDFNESPTPTPPVTRSGSRKRGRESPPNSEGVEQHSGKRPKMKAKRAIDIKLRKSIEEQKKIELISSDDDSKTEQVDEKNKKKKQAKEESDDTKEGDAIVVSSDAEKDAEVKQKKKKNKNKNKRLLSNLGINPEAIAFEAGQTIGVRQSRRIAQLKIREEAERRKLEDEIMVESQKKKKSKKVDKDYKVEKKRLKNECEDSEEAEDDSTDSKKGKKKKKKKKHRKLFDELNPWRSSSDSSSSNEEEEMGEEEEEEEDVLQYVSDHEFSPESDMEGDGEALPLKRARTARKESDVEEVDDCPCQKCGKSDHPEWILLCDSCDNGWHCSCLRPPLLVIPEGDWYCPPCQHLSLLTKLRDKLKEHDKTLHKKELEDRRKQRLAYVGISLNSVLPKKSTENIKKRRRSTRDEDDDDDDDDVGGEASSEQSESESGETESGSDSDEPIYQLRQRRQAHSYRFNDFDELINSAIQDEMEAVKGAGNQGRGKDISTIVNAEKEEERMKEVEEATEEPVEYEPLPPIVPVNDKDKEARPLFETDDEPHSMRKKIIGRKKHRKLNALDVSSGDDDADSDEDFKGTSSDSDDDFDDDLGSEDSDDLDSGRRRKGNDPVRRSTRARTSRYDADFIDDGESDSDNDAPRRKKKRSIWDESESEESDRSWGRRKRKPVNRSRRPASTSTSKKKSKKKKKRQDSDEEVYRKKKPKIKFGLDDDDDGPVRRTRGKKINYIDALGSDSDEDRVKRPPPRIDSDEEYVANEDDVVEDEKISDEERESGDENAAKASTIQIQSYTDARFTQLLPEPKNQLFQDEIEGELNPIDQINRNVEMMDENEMEKMMEEEEYANKQLQMVAQQLEKEKRRKEREAKKLENVLQQPPISQLQQDAKNRAKKSRDHFQFSGPIQEPLVGNVDNMIINSENNDELSEPPGVSLPMFAELGGSAENLEDLSKKRRAGKTKKTLEEAVANLGSARQHESASPFMSMGNKTHPTDLSMPQDSNIEIAAPPQPFSQSQPTPSVITRMLQSKPGQAGYPVGTIRPKQFATMPERDEDVHHPLASSPGHPGQYLPGTAALRQQMSSPYRQMTPSLNHYPRSAPPPQIRNPVPHLYHSHRPMDPSPSGGGSISISGHNSPGRVVSPASSSPGSNKNETPPPPYSRPPVVAPSGARFPMINTTTAGPRHIQQMVPPPHLQPTRPNLSPYHPGMPPQYHYGQFGQEDALPPTMYQSSPYSEPFEGQVNPSENSNSKPFEDESGGEFGGLVSYFSSQREDDLES